MPSQIVDLAARSQVFRAQRLLSHAWVASPTDVLRFLGNPRPELKKIGIHLPSSCRIETVLENHDWLTGHADNFSDASGVTVFCRGEGDGVSFYRVALYASKREAPAVDRKLLHTPHEEERMDRQLSRRARGRIDVTRRSLATSRMQSRVHEWLSVFAFDVPATKSLDEAHRILASITNGVSEFVRSEPLLQSAASKVSSTLLRPFNPSYSLVYRYTPSAREPFHSTFTTVMYAKALLIVQTSGWHYDALLEDSMNFLRQPERTLAVLERGLRSVDPDFVAHLTLETAARRDSDSFFASRMDRAKELFSRYYPKHPEPCSKFTRRASGLEAFNPSNESEWWFLPGLITFAIVAWPEDVHQARDLDKL